MARSLDRPTATKRSTAIHTRLPVNSPRRAVGKRNHFRVYMISGNRSKMKRSLQGKERNFLLFFFEDLQRN